MMKDLSRQLKKCPITLDDYMKLPLEAFTHSPSETEALGRQLAEAILEDNLPRFVAMYGDLGVGKTAFVRGFCSVLCPSSTVKSPTFALVNEYRCQQNCNKVKKVCHFDMYRVTDEDDLYSIGFYDYLRDDNLCIAEWCELIPYAIPDEAIYVKIEKIDFDSNRKITVTIQ